MAMNWWQVLLFFGGIPVVLFALITLVVTRLSTARVPDGLRGQGPDAGAPADE